MTQALLTVCEVADHLRVTTDTVYRLIRHDNLPAIKVGRQWRFVPANVEDWMQNRSQENRAKQQ
jgi:excisionase family DNA binding protein